MILYVVVVTGQWSLVRYAVVVVLRYVVVVVAVVLRYVMVVVVQRYNVVVVVVVLRYVVVVVDVVLRYEGVTVRVLEMKSVHGKALISNIKHQFPTKVAQFEEFNYFFFF